MIELKFKGLKKKNAENWMSIMVTADTLIIIMLVINNFWELIKKGTSLIHEESFTISLIVFFVGVAILVFMSNAVNWQIGTKISVDSKSVVLSYYEATTFLGVTGETKYSIEQLDDYDLDEKGLKIWGKIKYSAQMERTHYVNSVYVNGKLDKIEELEYLEKFLDTLKMLGGEVTPSRLNEVKSRIGLPKGVVETKEKEVPEQVEKQYAEIVGESVEEKQEIEPTKETDYSMLSEDELEAKIQEYKDSRENKDESISDEALVLKEDDMRRLKERTVINRELKSEIH